MSAKIYTDDKIKKLYEQYLTLKDRSVLSFAKENNISYTPLINAFKRLNLEIVPQSVSRRKFPINENYFENIDCEEKAYWLGFLYADACNTPAKNRLEVSLAKQDEEILEKLSATLLYGNLNIKEYKSKKKNRQDKVALFIINKKITQDLASWGCINRKTFVLKFPNISTKLYKHFVRGYFDGDGSLTFSIRKKTGKKDTNFSIVSTKEMLESISKLVSDLGINFSINKRHKKRKNNNYTLRISGNQQILRFCDWLYSEASIFMGRKYNNYLILKERI